jgi:cytochrome c oxidase cbb3-type subunit 3
MRKLLNNKQVIKAAGCMAAIIISTNASAAGAPAKSDLDNPLAVSLLIIIAVLALAIALLGHVLIGMAHVKAERVKKEKTDGAKIVSLILLCLVSSVAMAQDAGSAKEVVNTVSNNIYGLSKITFYSLMIVLGLEAVIIVWMLWFLKGLIAKEKAVVIPALAKESKWKDWWLKINSFRSMNEEKDIDMGHDYDNIRELDNKLPPWWLYGFYITIVFAGIYLWRYHVSHSAPLSHEELQIELAKAEEEEAIRLQKSGGGIDENTVSLLTAAADIEAGRKIFGTSCAACHAQDGGGIVGPNLTDDYWLHGGSVKDIFKTIKYGVPDKGMQPWKGQFSPAQLAQLASYIKSIKGNKVANPKEPQGDLFKDQPAASDSTRLAAAK